MSEATAPSQFVQEIEWGEDPSDLYRRLRFSLQAGVRTRLAILDEKVQKTFVHYGRFYFYCLGDECPACIEKQPSPRYLAWIFHYATNEDGDLIVPLQGQVKAWMFGRDKYSDLSAIKREWNDLRQTDILVECTEQKYQRMSITAARDSAWMREENRDYAPTLIQMLKDTRVDSIDLMARALTVSQIEQQMSGRPAEVEAPVVAGLQDTVVGPESVAASSETLSSLLDQLT